MQRHMKTHIPKEKPTLSIVECDYCKKSFSTNSSLVRDIKALDEMANSKNLQDNFEEVITAFEDSLMELNDILSILGDFIANFSWLLSVSHFVCSCVNYWSQKD